MLAGIATENRHDAVLPGLDHTGLMLAATLRALDDAGVGGERVGAMVVPRGSWSVGNPAARIADELGAPHAHTVIAELGITQTSAIAKAWDLIADGTDVVVVVGGETRHRDALAKRAGLGMGDLAGTTAARAGDDRQPGETLAPAGNLVSKVDVQRHLAVPAHQYAIVESALRHRAGRTPAAHAAHLGELWHRGALVAADNPDAWNRRAPSAAEIATAGAHNRMIAAPYTKSLVSQWTVDQAAAMVFVSAQAAAGLADQQRLIHPLAAADSNQMVPLVERAELWRWPAMGECGRQALADAAVDLDQVDLIDLYSCFPAAVQVSAAELGLDLSSRPWTVTGGMTFGGGPLNNYTFQSVVKMAEILRTRPGSIGLTTSVSGFLTKPAVALWSSAGDVVQCTWSDVSAASEAVTGRVPVDTDAVGAGSITGYTVLPGADGGPERVIAIIDTDAGRTIAVADESDAAASVLAVDAVGRAVTVTTPGVMIIN